MKMLPKAAWMSAVVVGMSGASQLRPVEAQSSTKLLAAPLVPSGRLTLNSEGTWKIVTINTVTGLQYRIDAIDADVPALLKALSETSHTRIIVSDDVHSRLPFFRNSGNPVATVISRIATAAGLAVGKIGTDTYLIVNAPPTAERVPLIIAPYAPNLNSMPVLGGGAKPDPHRNWSPRTFNGMTYYMIPLGPGATTTTATPMPELPMLTAPLLPGAVPAAPRVLLSPGAITPAK